MFRIKLYPWFFGSSVVEIVVKFQNILERDENFAFLKNEISFNFFCLLT